MSVVGKRASSSVCLVAAAAVGMLASGTSALAQKHDPADLAKRVDAALALELPGQAGSPHEVKLTDDETFLRRVSLDLVGDLPSPEEVTAFVLDPSPDKRAKAVDRLLASEQFGQNWGRYFRDAILYRRSDERALLVGPSVVEFLTKELNRGTGWDKIAAAFITAKGDVREEGATGLIMAQMGQAPEVAAETARIFLGVQIQCAQCHDHPTDHWKRKQFHELAAFFPRIAIRRVPDKEKRSFEVVSRDSFGSDRQKKDGKPRGSAEHHMPDLNDPSAEGTLMQPVFFVTGKSLPVGTKDVKRRESLAEWITAKSNPWFARAFVNRIWAELVGEGFYEPIDDLGPDRKPSAPNTVDMLSKAFAFNGYDIKWLMRTITATEAYQRESRTRRDGEGTPFVANCPQPLRADQIYDVLTGALALGEMEPPRPNRPGGGPPGLRGPRGEFNRTFGFDPSLPRDEVGASIPQALLLMNSPIVNRAINGHNPTTVLGKLLAEKNDDETVATELYLRCLAREPRPDELAACLAHVKESGDRAEAFEDVLWALVNSTEFLHRR